MFEMRVALDADGVLHDLDSHWATHASKVLGRPLCRVSSGYSFTQRLGLDRGEEARVWDTFAGEWCRVPLHDHARELVYALEDLGCEVFVVTAINPRHHHARAVSLMDLVPENRIICVNTDDIAKAKVPVLEHLGVKAFLDDLPENANAAMSTVPLSVCIDRGYTGVTPPLYGVTVIDDVRDFPVLVEECMRRSRGNARGASAS